MVEIQKLRKEFGPILAVDGVSFTVGQGEVLGFLGPNGAGKSTTMKMITGFLTPTSGTVRISGFDIQEHPLEAKKRIGYLPEGAPAYLDMTPATFLTFIAEMRGFRGAELRTRVSETVEKVNLQSVLKQQIDTLSKGFKRRVGLAQAILHDPEVLVLDEPTDGLDPNQKHEVRTLIKNMAKEKAIILSTHILEEVQAVCTRAMIIAKGKVVTDGTPADLEERSPNHNTVILAIRGRDVQDIQARLMNVSGVKNVQKLGKDGDLDHFRIFPDQGKWIIADVGHCAKEQQWEVDELYVDRGQLDEVFRSLTISKQELT
ncbi:MAG: ATP-binding cassette domain-containing protein [Nitrospirota bacterium]|nr:MAG: ATP-binding cassette domain-containing protein [Nitrospirota bacterium]